MNLSENAISLFKKLYFRRDKDDNFIEGSPDDVFKRVAFNVSSCLHDPKYWEDEFKRLMDQNYFRPCSPCLMNVGAAYFPQTAACFVGDLQDDLISIFDFDKESGIIFSKGSGIGGNFGILRETGALLNTGGRSSGPFSFMKKWAATADAVKSGGANRRAAEMCMFVDNHPDLLEFITIKNGKNQQALKSMNLSIAISNNFMNAVKDDASWDLLGVVDRQVKSTHKARTIFNTIAENAHKTGDPGVWFIDRANEDNGLQRQYGRMISTNPCGEIGGLPYYACALSSINLVKFINNNSFNYDEFIQAVISGTTFLDAMISISGYPTMDYDDMARQTRPLGLGIMGLADMLCSLDIPYDSQEAYSLCNKITYTLTKTAIETSIKLGGEYGSFPSLEDNIGDMVKLCAKFGVTIDKDTSLRNSNWTTIAPTGSISISCDCSPGMEPLFGITYTKNLADSNEKWIFVNPVFEEKYKNESWYKEAIEEIELSHGSCQGIACVPKDVQRVWRVAHDIHWKDRIEMQAALQRNISNAISSTLNMPRDATVDEIKAIYTLAWEKGLKGITVYRDGSLDSQPVEFSKNPEKAKAIEECKPKEFTRSKVLNGKSYCVVTGHGKIYLSINTDADGNVAELFVNGAKGGGVSSSMMEAIGRLSSLALQKGVHIEAVAKSLLGISDGRMVWDRLSEDDIKSTRINSVPDAVAQVLHRFYVNNKDDTISIAPTESVSDLRCPECGGPAVFKEGCIFCPSCGSKCG